MPNIDTSTASIEPWSYWTVSETSTITTTDSIFSIWADSTASITATDTTAWSVWCENGPVFTPVSRIVPVQPEPAPVERQIARAIIASVETEAKKRIQKEKERREKAITLLREALDPKQRADFDKHGYFYVQSPSGNLYRIHEGRAGNIEQLASKTSRNRRIATLCAHSREWIPDPDTMLTQKIMLEHREKEFRQIANISVH